MTTALSRLQHAMRPPFKLNHVQVTHSPNRYQKSALFDALYRLRTIINTLDHVRSTQSFQQPYGFIKNYTSCNETCLAFLFERVEPIVG